MKHLTIGFLIIGVEYLLLFFIVNSINLFLFMLLLFILPIIINQFTLNFVRNKNDNYKHTVYIIFMTLFAMFAYSIFAIIFENSPSFLTFVDSNSTTASDALEIEIADKLFTFSQVFTVGLINFAVLFLGEIRRVKKQKNQAQKSWYN